MSKSLESILGTENITTSGFMSEVIDLDTIPSWQYTYKSNYYNNSNLVNCAIIDFKGLGTDYKIQDLFSLGFDSTCATCSNHYSVQFRRGDDINNITDGRNYIVNLGIEIGPVTPEEFVKYIYDSCKAFDKFINHFQQYAYSGTKLYIYDYRPQYQGTFYTSAFVIYTLNAKFLRIGRIFAETVILPEELGVWFESSDEEENEIVPPDKFNFKPNFLNVGHNVIYITAIKNNKTYSTELDIIAEEPRKPIKFECHYHGNPVPIGTNYDLGELHAYLLYSNKEREDITADRYKVDSQLVTKEGNNNFYLATYSEKLVDKFVVCGYNVYKVKDNEFRIFSLTDDEKFSQDVTDIYKDYFYDEILDKIYITTNRLHRYLTQGLYLLYLPKNTGLCIHAASIWKCIKTDTGTKVTPIKINSIYDKEDAENGENQEEQQ